MGDAIWIGLYVLGALACVPGIARWVYDEPSTVSKTTCISLAFVICYAWPAFVGWWLLTRLSRLLVPVVFGENRESD